jgi:ATP-dependent Clp protease ATP-binding subunit ClpC
MCHAWSVFERFNDTARQVIVQSQRQARALNHASIGTEHILLGVMLQPEQAIIQIFESHGVGFDAALEQIKHAFGAGDHAPDGHIPFSLGAKRSLEFAFREALELGHTYIGPEHLLLGVLREGEGGAVQVLLDLKINPEDLTREINEKWGPTASA